MIKFFKKHKLKIITSLFCAFALSVFTILSFGCKTYAYTIDNNGNLVGDNLINCPNYHDFQTANKWDTLGIASITDFTTDYTISFTYQQSISGNGGMFLVQNTEPYIPYSIDYPYLGDKLLRTYEYGYVGSDIDVVQHISSSEISMPYIMLVTRSRNNKKVLNLVNVMLNKGNEALTWEPYGVWYSENNYNAVLNDNEELQEQINNRDIKNLLSGIKVNLEETNLRIYNSTNLSLSQMLGSTPFHVEMISFNTNDYNYDMQKCNIDTYNAIMNNGGEFSNGDTLTNDSTLLYTFKTPLLVESLTFSRNSTEGTRYINLYFSDNTSTELILSEGSENNRLDITWVNSENKYIQYISTTAEINYNAVVFFSIPNGSQIYSSGYANGYSDGMYEQYQNDASAIQNANQDKQAMYNSGYAKGYQEASSKNDVGWQSLFFAMADTPIRVVSNVLGFELFGLNLFSTFIGMVTVFAIVWLIKKFI